jgi:hypothetical protein
MKFHDYLEGLVKSGDTYKNVGAIDDGWMTELGAVPGEYEVDFLLIGGEPIGTRKHWIEDAPNIVKPGGWVMLGNANRPEYAAEVAALKKNCSKVETFDFNDAGSKFRVVEFYRLKQARKQKENETRDEPAKKKPSERD